LSLSNAAASAELSAVTGLTFVFGRVHAVCTTGKRFYCDFPSCFPDACSRDMQLVAPGISVTTIAWEHCWDKAASERSTKPRT